MADSFDAKIDKIIADTQNKMLAVLKNSIQEIVKDSQTPVAKGGKMRVDTGFLRSSGVATLNQIPAGKTEGRKRSPGEIGVLPEYNVDDNASYITDILTKMKIGDIFYFGWTARYAQYREMYDGFMISAISKFQQRVDEQIRRLKK